MGVFKSFLGLDLLKQPKTQFSLDKDRYVIPLALP